MQFSTFSEDPDHDPYPPTERIAAGMARGDLSGKLEATTKPLEIDTADELGDLARASRDRLVGRLRIGIIPTIAPYFLPGLLSRFAKAHPDIAVIVQEDTTENLIKRCSHGEIDLAILALPIIAKSLEVEPLFDEELLLVLPVGHPLAMLPDQGK
mgnify:CR=1 FL=1